MRQKDVATYIKPKQNLSNLGLLQAHIDKQLLDSVRKQRAKDNVTWKALVEGLLKFYLDSKK